MCVMYIQQINKLSPKNQKFFVDTNIWIFQSYISGILFDENKNEKSAAYSDFIQKVLDSGCQLFTSSLCLSEIGHVIEKKFFKIYKMENPSVTLKQFRAITQKRNEIISIVKSIWEEINSLSTIIDFSVTKKAGDNMLEKLQEAPLDTYDAQYLLIMEDNKITNILTDDKDFRSVSGIDIYTL